MTIAERNRNIAEFLEPEPSGHARFSFHTGHPNAWIPARTDWNDRSNTTSIAWQPCDFFTEERANAMLMDRMLAGGWDLHFGSANNTGGGIWCQINSGTLEVSPDRRTAVVAAFERFIERGGK